MVSLISSYTKKFYFVNLVLINTILLTGNTTTILVLTVGFVHIMVRAYV